VHVGFNIVLQTLQVWRRSETLRLCLYNIIVDLEGIWFNGMD